MRHIHVMGSDCRMDQRGIEKPITPMPIKCDHCGVPEYSHVPQPYYLVKGRTMSPDEMASAENGSFFVRQRVRSVLETVVPGVCDFYPTVYKGTEELTPWFLAVPADLETQIMKPDIPVCQKCGFPQPPEGKGGDWADRTEPLKDFEAKVDIYRTNVWTWRTLPCRWLYMSVRLFSLLKQIKAKGLDEQTCGKTTSPDKEEAAWVKEQIAKLESEGIALQAPGMVSADDAKWYRKYLKEHACESRPSVDLKKFEKQLKFKLPKSYKDFISKVGSCCFDDVDEQDGFAVKVLEPQDFDSESYRTGVIKAEDEESNAVDGVMFAETDHGDCFCFDVRKDRKEFEVFIYLHEYNCFESYAPNFATCIKRFAGK